MLNCFCDYDDECCCRGEFLPKKLQYPCNFGGACCYQIGIKLNPPKSEDVDSKNCSASEGPNNAESVAIALKDIESFCEGRISIGRMSEAYRDVLGLVRQHINSAQLAHVS